MLVGYARVSTQDQNPELQTDALSRAGCEKVFTEQASGARGDRPELLAAIDYVREGDTLMVWKLDRLARSLKQLIQTVEGLEDRNVGLRSLTEAIDTTTSGGRLIFHIFASLAEFERSIIRERTRAGLDAAIARGRKGGRPSALNDADRAVALTLFKDGTIPVRDIAKRVGVSEATLYRYFPGGRTAIEEAS